MTKSEEIYESLLLPLKPGDFLAHRDWQRIGTQADMQQARRKYLNRNGRALEVEFGKGYRVARAEDHDRIASQHNEKACRQIRRGRKTIRVAMEQHSEEIPSEKLAYMREYDERLSKVESAVRAINKREERFRKALNSLDTNKVNRTELDEFRREMIAKIESMEKRAA